MKLSHYEFKYRCRAIVGLVVIPIALSIFLFWALPVNAHELPIFLSLCLFLGICVAYFLSFTLFLLSEYRCTEDGIEQIGPLPGKHYYLRFSEIRACRHFTYEPRLDSRQGYIFVGNDGTKIILIDALPIWPEIANHIGDILNEPHPFLIRMLLLIFRSA